MTIKTTITTGLQVPRLDRHIKYLGNFSENRCVRIKDDLYIYNLSYFLKILINYVHMTPLEKFFVINLPASAKKRGYSHFWI